MVVDNIKNACHYYGLSDRIKTALEYIKNTDFTGMEPGRYEIDGSNVYFMVQKYESKLMDKGVWEAHKNYIDIQYLVDGAEAIGYSNIEHLKVSKEYDPSGDYMLLEGKGGFLNFSKGDFAILWPEDAHMPGIAIDKQINVTKVVAKVKI